MELPVFLNLSLTTWLTIALAAFLLWLSIRRPACLPPGPWIIFPLLGHLPLIEKDTRKSLSKLGEQYGDIFHLYLGNTLTIVLNSYETLYEALVKNGDVFSERPHVLAFEYIGKNGGVILNSGPSWKENRKCVLESLRELGFGRNIMQEKILTEVDFYIKAIEEEKGQAFDIKNLVKIATYNVIGNIAFGKRFDYNDPTVNRCVEIIDHMSKLGEASGIMNCIPLLKYLPGDLFHMKSLKAAREEIDAILLKPQVHEQMRRLDDNGTSDSIVDLYVRTMKKLKADGIPTTLNEEELVNVAFDLFGAGSETTSSIICYALIYLLKFPSIQQRIHDDIQNTIGMRSPRMEDRANLPYVEAFIMEVLRHADLVPLSISHSTTREITLRGYKIPEGTIVIPFLHSALRDPNTWTDPDSFNPERFLKNSNLLKMDQLVPFSLGRRVCLGMSVARMQLFLFLVSMIQRFRFVCEGDSPPSETNHMIGVTYSPDRFKLRAISRY